MGTLLSLFVAYIVVGVLLWFAILRHPDLRYRRSAGNVDRWRGVAIATKVALGWPGLLVLAALSREFVEVDAGVSTPVYRKSRDRSTQELDEVGRSARVLSSEHDGYGRIVVKLVSSDFPLSPDRHSGGVVCPVVVDRWTVCQLSRLLDRVAVESPGEFSVDLAAESDWDSLGDGYLPHAADHRSAREYLRRLVEVRSPPIHPLFGAAVGSLVAASEARDLGVMTAGEVDVVEAVLDFASRGDGPMVARVASALIDDLRSGGTGGTAL